MKLYRCKGPDQLPLIEVPVRGRIRERLSPGTMREPDVYENFRWAGSGEKKVLLACRRGRTRKGKCTSGQVVLRVTHPRSELKRMLRECRSGSLSRRRKVDINKILRDVKDELGQVPNEQSHHPFIAPHMVATTPMGRIGQFMFTSLVTALLLIFWTRLFEGDAK